MPLFQELNDRSNYRITWKPWTLNWPKMKWISSATFSNKKEIAVMAISFWCFILWWMLRLILLLCNHPYQAAIGRCHFSSFSLQLFFQMKQVQAFEFLRIDLKRVFHCLFIAGTRVFTVVVFHFVFDAVWKRRCIYRFNCGFNNCFVFRDWSRFAWMEEFLLNPSLMPFTILSSALLSAYVLERPEAER